MGKDIKSFESKYKEVGKITFPEFKNLRIMMMPFMMNDLDTLPDHLEHWKSTIKQLREMIPDHVVCLDTKCCYLTIDEMELKAGSIQRNPGLHVDGMYQGVSNGAWGGNGGGSWGSIGNGMLLANNIDNTLDIYDGVFCGYPINDGDCEHLRTQLFDEGMTHKRVKAGEVIWADGLCVHESLPVKEDCKRQFIRISLPNNGPWFADYTLNRKVQPNGEILPARLKEQAELYKDKGR